MNALSLPPKKRIAQRAMKSAALFSPYKNVRIGAAALRGANYLLHNRNTIRANSAAIRRGIKDAALAAKETLKEIQTLKGGSATPNATAHADLSLQTFNKNSLYTRRPGMHIVPSEGHDTGPDGDGLSYGRRAGDVVYMTGIQVHYCVHNTSVDTNANCRIIVAQDKYTIGEDDMVGENFFTGYDDDQGVDFNNDIDANKCQTWSRPMNGNKYKVYKNHKFVLSPDAAQTRTGRSKQGSVFVKFPQPIKCTFRSVDGNIVPIPNIKVYFFYAQDVEQSLQTDHVKGSIRVTTMYKQRT